MKGERVLGEKGGSSGPPFFNEEIALQFSFHEFILQYQYITTVNKQCWGIRENIIWCVTFS